MQDSPEISSREEPVRPGTGDVEPVLAQIAPGWLFRILALAAIVLVVLSLIAIALRHSDLHQHWTGFVQLFHLDMERNIPTWFESAVLFLDALLLALIARHEIADRSRWRFYWALLAAIFLLLSLDEIAGLHERLITPVREALGAGGPFYFAWIIPVGGAVIVLGFAYLRFLMALPRRSFRLFTLSATLFIGGAVGVEMVGGAYYEAQGHTPIYDLITAAEEILEFAGAITFAHALADHARRTGMRWTLSFGR